jgi:hypothetical protein
MLGNALAAQHLCLQFEGSSNVTLASYHSQFQGAAGYAGNKVVPPSGGIRDDLAAAHCRITAPEKGLGNAAKTN